MDKYDPQSPLQAINLSSTVLKDGCLLDVLFVGCLQDALDSIGSMIVDILWNNSNLEGEERIIKHRKSCGTRLTTCSNWSKVQGYSFWIYS